jgi:hypothetical protein
LLPLSQGDPPSLSDCLTALDALASAPEDQRKAGFLALAARLPPPARLLFTRLAAGTFRQTIKPLLTATDGPRDFLAILTLLSPQGPEAAFALRHGNGLVPITKLPLTLPETPEILAWARAHTLDRFGPNLSVTPDLVFRMTCEGTTPNPRRKSKIDLTAPRLIAWVREATPDQATTLDQFTSFKANHPLEISHGGPGV